MIVVQALMKSDMFTWFLSIVFVLSLRKSIDGRTSGCRLNRNERQIGALTTTIKKKSKTMQRTRLTVIVETNVLSIVWNHSSLARLNIYSIGSSFPRTEKRKNIHKDVNDIDVKHHRCKDVIFSTDLVSFSTNNQLSVHSQELNTRKKRTETSSSLSRHLRSKRARHPIPRRPYKESKREHSLFIPPSSMSFTLDCVKMQTIPKPKRANEMTKRIPPHEVKSYFV